MNTNIKKANEIISWLSSMLSYETIVYQLEIGGMEKPYRYVMSYYEPRIPRVQQDSDKK